MYYLQLYKEAYKRTEYRSGSTSRKSCYLKFNCLNLQFLQVWDIPLIFNFLKYLIYLLGGSQMYLYNRIERQQ